MEVPDVEFELTRADLRRYARFVLRWRARAVRRTPGMRLLLAALVVLVGVAVALIALGSALEGGVSWLGAIVRDPLLRGLALVLAVVAGVVVVLRVVVPHLSAGQAMKSRHVRGLHRLRVEPDGLHAESPHARTTFAWSGIEAVERRGDDLYVMLSAHQGLVVPASAFGDDDAARTAFERRCRQLVEAAGRSGGSSSGPEAPGSGTIDSPGS